MKPIALLSSILLAVLAVSSLAFAEGGMSVQVRELQVKSTPNYLGATTAKLVYGQAVEIVSEEGNWYKIASPSGYIPKTAVTKGKLVQDPDQKFAAGSVKHDEVALAGKGFNPQVEAQYKRDNAGMAAAFAQVDKIEKLGASDAELRAFQSAGKLKPRN